MSEWISVKDKLPELVHEVDRYGPVWSTPHVLCYVQDIFVVGYFDHQVEHWYNSCPDELLLDVTHWMPLPEPPDTHAPSDCDPTGRNIESGPGQ